MKYTGIAVIKESGVVIGRDAEGPAVAEPVDEEEEDTEGTPA